MRKKRLGKDEKREVTPEFVNMSKEILYSQIQGVTRALPAASRSCVGIAQRRRYAWARCQLLPPKTARPPTSSSSQERPGSASFFANLLSTPFSLPTLALA